MGKASQRKARKRLERAGSAVLRERVQHSPAGVGTPILTEVPGVEKMSEVLSVFAEPLLEDCASAEDFRKAMGFAVMAWNLSLLPEAVREQDLTLQCLSALGPAAVEALRLMIERKLALFAENRRSIVDFELTDLGGGKGHLSIVSGAPLDAALPGAGEGGAGAREQAGEQGEPPQQRAA